MIKVIIKDCEGVRTFFKKKKRDRVPCGIIQQYQIIIYTLKVIKSLSHI